MAGPLAIAGAVLAARSLTQRPPVQPVQARSTQVNSPARQDPFSKTSSLLSIANAAKSGQTEPKKETTPPNDAINRRLDASSQLSNHNQTLNTFKQAEQQLNAMPQDQRLIYGPPFYQTVYNYHQDYKSGRVG